MPIGIGLHGANGHQIYAQCQANPDVRVVAATGMPPARLAELKSSWPDIAIGESLDELIDNPRVNFISLCSPRRADQAADAIRALQAGKHVYAEKPCAMTERELDAIMEAAANSEGRFHEMAGTAFAQPWLAMREVVQGGRLGTIVQILAQKSYPLFEGRPQDEQIDGGLTCQVGVHAYRWIEHVAGERIAEVRPAMETTLGNPVSGGQLRLASTSIMTLESGAIATVISNYLNPPGLGSWGNEMLRIFGTKGFVEATDGGSRTRLIIGKDDLGPLDLASPDVEWFDRFIDDILGRTPMPLSLEDELHPTCMVIRARNLLHEHA